MSTNNYEDNFALFYNQELTSLSENMAEFYLSTFEKSKLPNQKVLDLMCGPGVLINKFNENGWTSYALDKSTKMVEIAQYNNEVIKDNIYNSDINDLDFTNEFSLVTCTADGLNHIKSLEELKIIFKKVKDSLVDEGFFAFDINTILGINNNDFYVSTNDNDTLIIRNGLTDSENGIGYTKFKGFFKYNNNYLKFETIIHNYMYKINSIIQLLESTGFKNIKILDASDDSNINDDFENPESCERVVLISQKSNY